MSRVMIASAAAALIAAAGIGFVAGAHRPPARSVAIVTPVAVEEDRQPIYFQDPDGKPAYSRTPMKTRDGRDYRAVPTGAGAAERKIKYYRNPMGLPDTSRTP